MEKIENLRDEEKLLALFCHFSVFFGGLLVPVLIWAFQKDKSRFVRFHSLQSIFGHLIFSFGVAIFAVLFFGIAVAANFSFFENSGASKNMPPLFIGLIIIFSLIVVLLALAFIGFSVYWGVKAYNGYLSKIPLIGNIIYKKVYGEEPIQHLRNT